jgi:hypothetical protein
MLLMRLFSNLLRSTCGSRDVVSLRMRNLSSAVLKIKCRTILLLGHPFLLGIPSALLAMKGEKIDTELI